MPRLEVRVLPRERNTTPYTEPMEENVDTEAKSVLVVGIEDVRAVPLGRLAQEGKGAESMCRVLPGYDAKRVAVAAFQSSI